MLEEENRTGASRPHDQIKGELLATFAALKAEHGLERLELAWHVMMALEKHIRNHEGQEQWLNFTARLAEMSSETITEIDLILHEDAKANSRLH